MTPTMNPSTNSTPGDCTLRAFAVAELDAAIREMNKELERLKRLREKLQKP